MARQLAAKRLELLRELVPNGLVVAMLVNPTNPTAETDIKDVEEAAGALGEKVQVFRANKERDFDTVFKSMVERRAALFVSGDPFFGIHRELLVLLSVRYAIPMAGDRSEWALAGGLMSYGSSFTEAMRQVGFYTGRVLKGEKPADLPVIQPTKFDLILNLRTARVLGIEVPETLLATADELIK